VSKLVTSYRVLALVVGVLLVAGTISSILKYAHWLGAGGALTEGSDLQQLGDELTWIWLVHGWIYMVYVVVAFLLSRRAGWSLQFLGVLLLAGLVPVMIFFVEHRVIGRLKVEHPEAVG
jgi:integral membrane protein